MNEAECIRLLWSAKLARHHDIGCPNAYMTDSIEMDLATVDHKDRLWEWEIKRTAADMRKDAEKVYKRSVYASVAAGQPAPSFPVPHKYVMVCFGFRPSEEDMTTLPAYAGLWVHEGRHVFNTVRKPTPLHERTLEHRVVRSLWRKLSYRVLEDNAPPEEDFVI